MIEVLVQLWRILGLNLGILGAIWDSVGASWGRLGSVWAPSWLHFRPFGSTLASLGALLGASGRHIDHPELHLGSL